jgi:hypothetical protein
LHQNQKIHPEVVFTSGRRAKEDQARAMASNVVQNRKWIEETYVLSDLRTKCQQWVDNNPNKKTQAEITDGLLSVLNTAAPADLSILLARSFCRFLFSAGQFEDDLGFRSNLDVLAVNEKCAFPAVIRLLDTGRWPREDRGLFQFPELIVLAACSSLRRNAERKRQDWRRRRCSPPGPALVGKQHRQEWRTAVSSSTGFQSVLIRGEAKKLWKNLANALHYCQLDYVQLALDSRRPAGKGTDSVRKRDNHLGL